MTNLAELHSEECVATPDGKRLYNEVHFTESARHYDKATAAMSLGQDASWKRHLIEQLPLAKAPKCLDLACGTGDLTFALASHYPQGSIDGIDITQEMLNFAKLRCKHSNISFLKNDMAALDYPDSSMDIVTGGYALRNAPNLEQALAEIYRVLKPGGTAAFLDFSKPVSPRMQKLEYWTLKLWCSMWGIILHGTPKVHGYISVSLRGYPDCQKLDLLYQRVGFTLVHRKRFLFGITEVFLLRKKSS